jgi:hypothetical protein
LAFLRVANLKFCCCTCSYCLNNNNNNNLRSEGILPMCQGQTESRRIIVSDVYREVVVFTSVETFIINKNILDTGYDILIILYNRFSLFSCDF